MTKEEILNKITCNGMREITEERALQAMEEYAQQIVLDKLPDGGKAVEIASLIKPKLSTNEEAFFIAGFTECLKYIATQRITTREEVEKPYRELLEEVRAYAMPPSLRQRINELLKP